MGGTITEDLFVYGKLVWLKWKPKKAAHEYGVPARAIIRVLA